MLERKIEKDINLWIKNSDKALLVYGVRQSGKTYIIRKCLKNNGCNFVEFNLIEQPQIVDILAASANMDDLILKLSLYSKKQLTPDKTIIFFDEIQRYKEIVTKIKFLVEDKRFRFILSGSLLGVEIVNLKSAPVGYLQSLIMYPLDFEEFLQLFNVSTDVFNLLKNCYKTRTAVDEAVHTRFLQLFNLYLIIGGMPAAVEAYRVTEDINRVITEHLSIIEQYRLDFTQYEEENKKLLLTRTYDLIPAQLNDKNKRFKVSEIKKSLRYDRVQDSFLWMWKAGVAIPAFNTTEPVVPLLINEKSSLFKLFLSDCGLLTTLYGKAAKLRILNGEDINKGAIYENVVAQELNAHKYPLYYFNSHKFGELDFVIEHNGAILPIEVKSGKDYERHSALNNVLNVADYNIGEAIVLSNGNVSTCGKVVYLPVYMVMFISEDDINLGKIPIENFSF